MTETINIRNLTKLINHLRLVNAANFTMGEWFDQEYDNEWEDRPASELVTYMQQGKGDCGTVGCIAGHAGILDAAEKGMISCNISGVQYTAREWLGLSEDLKNALFMPGR